MAQEGNMTSATTTIEIASLPATLKATWMAGNYDYFSRFMESSAVAFLDRLPLSFAVVATCALGVLFLGWRGLAALVAHRVAHRVQ